MKRRAPSHSLLTFLLASCMAVATVTTAFGEGLGEPGNSTSAVNDAYADVVNSTSDVNDAYVDVDNSTSAVNDAYADVDNSTGIFVDTGNSTGGSGDAGNSTGIFVDMGNSTGGSGDAGNETVIGDDARISVRGSRDLTYTGSALTFDSLKVYFSNELLGDDDYEIVYKNNVNVGKASFTITFAGESETFYFNIKPASLANATVKGIKNKKTYTGKALTQNPTVTVSGRTLKRGSDYTLSYSNNTKVGTAKVTITGKGNYAGSLTKKFTITKAANTLKVKAKSRTVKHTKVAKKNTSLPRSKVLRVSKAKGKVTYAKKRGNKKITVNKETGEVTVKKGLAKGAYKVKVKVTAAGNENYKKASKTVTFKVIVK